MKAELTIQSNPIAIYTKKLVPMDEFYLLIDKLPPKEYKKAVKTYGNYLKQEPKRTEFLNFDEEGFYLEDNKPMFKGFVTCDEASTEEKKVALFQDTRLYFYPADDVKGVVLYHPNFATDRCTYNELAIAFNPKNNMERLEFA
tara:strand:- start:228 stop:656 length:429 start_codon:yes stop_codon:yes gene_type:complete